MGLQQQQPVQGRCPKTTAKHLNSGRSPEPRVTGPSELPRGSAEWWWGHPRMRPNPWPGVSVPHPGLQRGPSRILAELSRGKGPSQSLEHILTPTRPLVPRACAAVLPLSLICLSCHTHLVLFPSHTHTHLVLFPSYIHTTHIHTHPLCCFHSYTHTPLVLFPFLHTHTYTTHTPVVLFPFCSPGVLASLSLTALNVFSHRIGPGASEALQPSPESLELLKQEKGQASSFPRGCLFPKTTEAPQPSPHTPMQDERKEAGPHLLVSLFLPPPPAPPC